MTKLSYFRKLFEFKEIVYIDWPFTVLFGATVGNSVEEIGGSFVYELSLISIH